MTRSGWGAATLLVTVLLLAPVTGRAGDEGQERGGRRTPPPEAFAACKGQSAGTTVEITTPRGDTIKATCKQLDGQLVAVPDGPPPGNGSPPEGGEAGR